MLEIRLFGAMSLSYRGERVGPFATRKTGELFAYLALHRHRSFSRLLLASVLWPGLDETQARKRLRQSLWQIRKALGCVDEETSGCLKVDRQLVRFRPAPDVWLDTADFEECILASVEEGDNGLSEARRRRLERALDLYTGDLLEDCYEEWCRLPRDRFRSQFLDAAGVLLADRERRGEWVRAIDLARRVLEVDPLFERAHRSLMRGHYARVDRAAALKQFEACARLLDAELGVEPAPPTLALYRNIRDAGVEGLRPTVGEHTRGTASGGGRKGMVRAELAELEDLLGVVLRRLSVLRNQGGLGEPE